MVPLPLLCLLFSSAFAFRPIEDICRYPAGRRIYVDIGDTGTLTAVNVTDKNWSSSGNGYMPAPGPASGSTSIPGPGPPAQQNNLTSHQQCSVELVTCPSCTISVVFHRIDLSYQCGGNNHVLDSPCRCDYVWLSEPPFDELPGQEFCGIVHNQMASQKPTLAYESKTRTLRVTLFHSEFHQHAFTLNFVVKKNRQIISGSSNDIFNSTGTITSPFFPSRYPRDLSMEYLLTCSDSVDCRVRLIFSDYHLSSVSFMEFYDGPTQRLEVTSGSVFRPPVIVSSGSSLLVRFYANGGSNLGFKATYSFINEAYADTPSVRPITDCGGYVEDLGGAITMMNMVMNGVRSYDCVWLIRPPENFLQLKTHLYIKVTTFLDFAGSTELQIRRGLTTEKPVLETLRHPISQLHLQRAREHVIPVTSGFYVQLKGSFNAASRLAITYTTFSYNKCFPNTEYLCANHRCIPSKLSCDSFDHCGDNSDEPDTCFRAWETDLSDRVWYKETPNYFFPKTDRYADLKTATVVFLVSSLGLIILISALIVILYRMNSRARQQRELQNHLQTISNLLDSARVEDLSIDEPPVYEAPPDYEEIVKATTTSHRSKRHSGPRPPSRRSRSSPPERRRHSAVPVVDASHTSERHRSVRTRQRLHLQPDPMRRSSVISVTSVGAMSQQTLPESPPPPYSPTNSQQFVIIDTPMRATSSIETSNMPGSATAELRMIQSSTTWCVTAVTSNISPMSVLDENTTSAVTLRRQNHQRSLSCGDHTDYPHYYEIAERRLTQSNPLTPNASPVQERIHSPICSSVSPQPSQNTDSDIYLFSSLDSTELNSNYIKSKDFFDWEEFDRQFPGKVGILTRGSTVAEVLKKYDALVFSNGKTTICDCPGVCYCPSTSRCPPDSRLSSSTIQDQTVDVWGNTFTINMNGN